MKGTLPLFDKPGTPATEDASVENLKRLARLTLQVAVEAHGPQLEKHQSILAAVADLTMDAFALDAMTARNRQLAKQKTVEPWRQAVVQRYANEAHGRALNTVRRAMSSCLQGEKLTARLAEAAALIVYSPHDAEALDESLAAAVESARGYPSLG